MSVPDLVVAGHADAAARKKMRGMGMGPTGKVTMQGDDERERGEGKKNYANMCGTQQAKEVMGLPSGTRKRTAEVQECIKMAEDQTNPAWIKDFGAISSGTGVFLKLKDQDEFSIIFAKNVTYERCVEIASSFGYSALKWVPLEVAKFSQVRGSRCAVDGEPCLKSCKGHGCICHTTRKVCVSASSGGGSGEEMEPMEQISEQVELKQVSRVKDKEYA